MSSPESSSSSSGQPLKPDELSKRMFYGGCCGLPWLWIVHTLFWYGKLRGDGDELLVNNNNEHNRNDDSSDTTEEITLRELAWVQLCRSSAIVVTVIWIVWILLVQVILVGKLPDWLYVRAPDQGEYTGW